jgi:integrase
MMGCVYRPSYTTKDGTKKYTRIWWIKYYDHGQPIFQSSGTKDKAEARRFLRSKEGKVADGLPITAQHRIKFKTLADDVLRDYQVNDKKSVGDAEARFRLHINKAFGEMKAIDINALSIRRYIDLRQKEGAKNGTINRELTLIGRGFTLAMQAGTLGHKPHIPKLKESAARQGFFEIERFNNVVRYLPQDIQPVARFGYITGWRKQEILGLQWRQVDFEGRTVRLEPGTTKNDEGRTFYFTAELEALLLEQRKRANELRLKENVITPWVFNHRGVKRIKGFKRSWRTACRKAGCPGMLFHDLRRTAVRNLERARVPRSVAMKITGHKTENIYRRYAIASEGDLKEASARLDSLAGAEAKTVKVQRI